jgi:hypothetical protein
MVREFKEKRSRTTHGESRAFDKCHPILIVVIVERGSVEGWRRPFPPQ